MKKIAVILCGSGFKDGSEIHESVLALLSIAKNGGIWECFALDEPQKDVINCLTGEPSPETRIQRIEAARIARGEVKNLKELRAADFDALILPGGFGAAKNLCSYAERGASASVNPEVARVLDEFWASRKPIGAICIAPMILALHFRGKGLTLTLGPADPGLESQAATLGHRLVPCEPHEICKDPVHPVVTTPAYMHEKPRLDAVERGIHAMVSAVVGGAF